MGTSDLKDDLPLHSAVREDDVEKVKKLLGASKLDRSTLDINAEDENGITALIEACITGNDEIFSLLLEAGCPAQPKAGFRHSPIRGATLCGNARFVPILLKLGADVNALSAGDRTALMGACFLRKGVAVEKSALCVKELLKDERTDPTLTNSFGETALDMAKSRGYSESIVLLEEALERWSAAE